MAENPIQDPAMEPSKTRPALPKRILEKLIARWEAYFKKEIKPYALKGSLFGNLPLEMILLIVEFPPTSSAAAFALSCRAMKEIL
jgi:hypothetical protein